MVQDQDYDMCMYILSLFRYLIWGESCAIVSLYHSSIYIIAANETYLPNVIFNPKFHW